MGALARREAARRQSVRVGVVTTGGIVGLLAFAITAQNGMPEYVPGVSRTEVRAAFDDVGALRPGDDVRIANVRAGFVDDIELVDGTPVVTMRLDDGREVTSDASATIGARSALGQKYVELYPGSEDAPSIGDDLIPLERTTSPVELDQVLDVFDARTRKALGSTFRNVGGGLAGRSQDLSDGLQALPELLPDVAAVADALSRDGGRDLESMLVAADAMAVQLADQDDEIADLTRQTAETFDAFAVDEGAPLRALVTEGGSVLRSVREGLSSLDAPLADTRTAMVRLRRGADSLGAATPDVRGLLRESVDPLRGLPGMAELAEPAFDRLTPTMEMATPVVEQLGRLAVSALAPLTTFAPYAPEAMLFFTRAQSALSQGDAAGNWLRFYLVHDPESVVGAVPVRSPLTSRDPYPAPGAAEARRTNDEIGPFE